ncbi:MAG: hypothetical protein ACOC4R_00365 [Bacteroidota bacterium]
MEDKTGKILSILLYVLIGISVVLGIYYVFIADIPSEPEKASDITMYHMYWSYVLLAVAVILAVVIPIIYLIMNPAKAKNVLFAIIGFVVLAGISYLLASDSIAAPVYDKFDVTPKTSKYIGTGLIATYILGGLAIAATIFSGIAKIFK